MKKGTVKTIKKSARTKKTRKIFVKSYLRKMSAKDKKPKIRVKRHIRRIKVNPAEIVSKPKIFVETKKIKEVKPAAAPTKEVLAEPAITTKPKEIPSTSDGELDLNNDKKSVKEDKPKETSSDNGELDLSKKKKIIKKHKPVKKVSKPKKVIKHKPKPKVEAKKPEPKKIIKVKQPEPKVIVKEVVKEKPVVKPQKTKTKIIYRDRPVIKEVVKEKPKIIYRDKPVVKTVVKEVVKEKPVIKTVVKEKVVYVEKPGKFEIPKHKFTFLDFIKIFMVVVFFVFALALFATATYALINIEGFRQKDKIWIPIVAVVAGGILFTSPYFLARDYKKLKSLRAIHIIFVVLFFLVGAALIAIGILQFVKPELLDLIGGQDYIIIPILNCIVGCMLLASPIFVATRE